MKFQRSGWVLVAVMLCTRLLAADTTLTIIPEPVSIVKQKGNYTFPAIVTVSAPVTAEAGWVVQAFAERWEKSSGKKIQKVTGSGATIVLQKSAPNETTQGVEGYTLKVSSTGVVISASAPAGWFYGIQTLFQLLPKEIESPVPVSNVNWKVPLVTIIDKPRFGWRGLMFDVSRHFFYQAGGKTVY